MSAEPSHATFQNIPAEMRAYRQWLVWKLIYNADGAKPTKLPFNAITAKIASVTNPDDWCTFDEAVAASVNNSGIGFVFTKEDPFCGVDLDDTKGDAIALDRQKKIESEFHSYSEVSPSGRGLHVIVRGKLQGPGRRRNCIELYDRNRFFTMTGNVFRDTPIADRQELVQTLWAELGGSSPQAQTTIPDQPERESDEGIKTRVFAAVNGDKARNLFAGNWSCLYPSQSEADFALVDIIAFHTDNRAQVERIFLSSALGQREKAKRKAYVASMVEKSFDRKAPLVPAALALADKFRADLQSRLQSELQSNVFSFAAFTFERRAPFYVWHHVLQLGCVYTLTAFWGHAKTAIAITIAMHVATGRPLCGHNTAGCRVLYLCGENPDDVRLRVLAACEIFGIDKQQIDSQAYFTRHPFPIDNPQALKTFCDEAIPRGPFGLLVIDTIPAHSSAENENDNSEMHALAMALRGFMAALGQPATIALTHPPKTATRENMGEPRGGSALSASVDGLLYAWNEAGIVEFGHRSKFRGPGFQPMHFQLERHEFPGLTDNFGEPAVSIVAVETDAKPDAKTTLTLSNRIALEALGECLPSAIPPSQAVLDSLLRCNGQPAWPPTAIVPESLWRRRAYDKGISDGDQNAKSKAFRRARGKLIQLRLICTHADHYWLPAWCTPVLPNPFAKSHDEHEPGAAGFRNA